VVEVEDGQALADAIRRIMDRPDFYEQLSAGALNRYQKFFTKEKMIDRCVELYQQLLRRA